MDIAPVLPRAQARRRADAGARRGEIRAVTHRSSRRSTARSRRMGTCVIHEYAKRGTCTTRCPTPAASFPSAKPPRTSCTRWRPPSRTPRASYAPRHQARVLISDGDDGLLTDFGFALDYRKSKCVTRLGTTDYMAPEIVRCDKARRDRASRAGSKRVRPRSRLLGHRGFGVRVPGGRRRSRGGTTEETCAHSRGGRARDFDIPAEAGVCRGCLTRDPASSSPRSRCCSTPGSGRTSGARSRGTRRRDRRRPRRRGRVRQARCTSRRRDAGARLGRHKSASAGFFPAAEAALAERGGEGDAGPSARLPSLDHGGGLRSQSVTNVVGENLKRGLGRVREFLFWEQRGRSNRGRGGDDAEHDMGA